MNKKIKLIFPLLLLFLFTEVSSSDDKQKSFNDHQVSFHTGMFDFSDDGK